MNAAKLPVFNLSFKNQSDNSADIYIDGDIVDASTQEMIQSWFGDDTSTSYKSFRDQVNNSPANTFNVFINSGGGQITEALAIHDLLIDQQAKGKIVNTFGRGVIASAATYILMAGKNPSMSSNSFFMIHNASGAVYGDVNDIESFAVTLRKFNDTVTSFYQNATGLSKTVIGNMMNNETWMTADEAKANNFIKNVTGEVSFTNSIKPEKWQFKNTAILNSYNSFTNKKIPTEMDTAKITDAITTGFNSLMEKLGIKEKANDETVKNALTEFTNSIVNVAKGSVPAGGKKGQVLTKASDDDYDMDWEDDDDSDESDNMKKKKNSVNNLVAAALKNIGENEAFKNAIKESSKNSVTKEDFKNGMAELTKAVTDKMGNGSTGEPKPKPENEKKKGPKNRFANQYDNYYNNN